MTKADLIESLANTVDLPKGQAERVVNAVFDDIVGGLRKGDKVTLSGFGTFQVSERKARTGRNPKTGEAIAIPASKSVKFKAGKTLKDMLN
jgi:DNA-binding protein HU-beta